MKIRIAIVDDNTFLIKAVEEKLSFFDDLIVKFNAMNGEDLLEKLEGNHNLDLILMDIEMPVMNGIEATEKVKQKYPHIKIIMLTVFDNDENIFNAIGADPNTELEVNLPMQTITLLPTDEKESFEINSYKKNNLLHGYDDIDYLLNMKPDIEEFAKNTPI